MSRSKLAPLLIPAALIVAALAPLSFAQASDNPKVGEIDVQIDMAALTNAFAAKHYATIEADLENALTSRLVDRLDKEDGVKITVDLSEFELSNTYNEAMNLADTRLVGDVNITDAKDNSNFDSWKLTVDVNATSPFLPAGTLLTTLKPDSDVYYKAMIAAFADGVVVRLDQ